MSIMVLESNKERIRMKTIFVVASSKVNKHAGEEYDTIVEVLDEPTTDNIQQCADEVMLGIQNLWKAQDGEQDRKVVAYLDATSPFLAMLLNLQIIMKAQEGIVIDLPWYTPPDLQALDAESRAILEKLDKQQGVA